MTVLYSISCGVQRFPLPSCFVKLVIGGDATPEKTSRRGPWDALSDHLVRHNYLGDSGVQGDPFPQTPPRRAKGGQVGNSET